MGVTILENLAGQKPSGRHAKNQSLAVMYELVRSHRGEIEEAIERGYSWKQIDDACRVSWQEQSDKAAGVVWWANKCLVQACYKAIKHGVTIGKKKPLSLDVTITKR